MFKTISFGSTIILVLYGMIFVTYKIYSTYLQLNPFWSKIAFIIMMMMPILFIGSILMTRGVHHVNAFLYTAVQVFSGIGFYIFLSAIVLGLVGVVYLLLGTTMPLPLAYGFLVLPFVLSGIGFYQARQIVVTPYTVEIANLPKEWQGAQVALITDTHFGLVNYKNFSNRVVEKVLALNPKIVLHAGDFYDGPAIPTNPITESWQKLTNKVPVFYAPGNHEMYGDYTGFLKSVADAHVTVLDDKITTYEGIQIAGITYRDKNKEAEAALAINFLRGDKNLPYILINHPPTFVSEANDAGVDLMVSGHTHNGQFWPNTYLVRRIYGIYTYGLQQFKDTSVITSNGIGTFGPPMRLFNKPEVVLITLKNK